MGITNFPNGVSSFGVPLIGSGPVLTVGNVFFVDNGHASRRDAADHGDRPDNPFSTLDFAIGRCTANNGDVIFISPGHAETLTSATALVFDVAGVTAIGLGEGTNRPSFTITATSAAVFFTAPNCRLSNVRIIAGASAITAGICPNTTDVELDSIETNFTTAGADFIRHVDAVDSTGTTGIGTRLHIHDCLFIAEDAAGSSSCIRMDNANRVRIEKNTCIGQWTGGVILSTAGTSMTNIVIADNNISNLATQTTPAVYGIRMSTGASGLIIGNNISQPDGGTIAIGLTFIPGNCRCIENYQTNLADESGVLVPTTVSA